MSPLGILFLLFFWTSPAWAQNPWKWESKSFQEKKGGHDFVWTVPKLVSTPGDTALWQKLLDRHVAAQFNEFQNAYEEDRKELQLFRRESSDYRPAPWQSEAGFKVVWADPRHLVLLWEGYDFRGGAHGLPILEVSVLSTEAPDSLLPPSSLFVDHDQFLSALSAASRVGLLAWQEGHDEEMKSLDEWALKGTEPNWDNFAIVYPTQLDGPARFEVIFPSYQVGPYAIGTPTVAIPWQTLSAWAPSLEGGVALP